MKAYQTRQLKEDSLETRRNKHSLEAYESVTRYTLQHAIKSSTEAFDKAVREGQFNGRGIDTTKPKHEGTDTLSKLTNQSLDTLQQVISKALRYKHTNTSKALFPISLHERGLRV